jgi:hypothetical protein
MEVMAEYGARESSVDRGRASMAQPRPSGTILGRRCAH